MHVYNTYACKLTYTRNIYFYISLYSRKMYKGIGGFDLQQSQEAAFTQLVAIHPAFGQRPRMKKLSWKKTMLG